MKNIKAVIFDMDGVVINSEPLHQKSENIVYQRHGINLDPSDWDTFRGRTAKDMFKYIQEKYNVTFSMDVFNKEIIDEYQKLAKENLKVFEGFFELIEFLKPKYRLALATSAREKNQEFAFNECGLENIFEVVINSSHITKGKPHPEPYLITIKKLGLKPEECMVIEDAVNGVESAKAAGALTVAITSSFPKEKLTQADYIVDSLLEIKDILTN